MKKTNEPVYRKGFHYKCQLQNDTAHQNCFSVNYSSICGRRGIVLSRSPEQLKKALLIPFRAGLFEEFLACLVLVRSIKITPSRDLAEVFSNVKCNPVATFNVESIFKFQFKMSEAMNSEDSLANYEKTIIAYRQAFPKLSPPSYVWSDPQRLKIWSGNIVETQNGVTKLIHIGCYPATQTIARND